MAWGMARTPATLQLVPGKPGVGSGELFEGLLDAVGDGGGGVVEVVADLEHGGRRSGQRIEGFEGGGPVDGSVAGPEVLVFEAVVVVHVKFGDALAEGADGFGDSGRDVRVAEIEADADLVEVRHFENRQRGARA